MNKIKLLILMCLFSTLLNADQKVQIQGDVLVNGKKFDKNKVIKIGDFIETKKNSKVMFNIGKSAFLGKANSKFKIEEKKNLRTLNIVAGGVLAVFRKDSKKHQIKTPNMTAGIRGTGIFAQVKDGQTYFCTCYGETHIHTHKEEISLGSNHHNPVKVHKDGSLELSNEMINHMDSDLVELEAFVGRKPEFDR